MVTEFSNCSIVELFSFYTVFFSSKKGCKVFFGKLWKAIISCTILAARTQPVRNDAHEQIICNLQMTDISINQPKSYEQFEFNDIGS